MSENHSRYGRCIFCGDYKRFSEEHIWPKWMWPYLQFDEKFHGQASIDVHPDREEVVNLVHRQGDPRKRSVSKVCADCNSGWMSELQTRAKPHLLPLVQGNPCTFGEDGQRIVSAWVTMAVAVGEHHFELAAIPAVDRLNLRLTGSALRNWKIWAASYKRGDWKGHFAHCTRYLAERDEQLPLSDFLGRNTQTTTMVIGEVYFHAFSTSIGPDATRLLDSIRFDCEGRLLQIWPSTGFSIRWPPTSLTDLQADRLTAAIFNALDGRPMRGVSFAFDLTKA